MPRHQNAALRTIRRGCLTAFLSSIFLAAARAADGDFLSVIPVGGTGRDECASVAVDPEGNVYVAGYFTGTMDFDPGPDVLELTSANNSRDIFVMKFDPFRNLVWAFGLGGDDDDEATAISIDSNGSISLAGYFQGGVDFNPGPGETVLSAVGSRDLFFARYTAAGQFIWVRQVGGQFDEFVYDIVIDESGNVYSTGFFQGTVDFDPGPAVFNVTANDLADIFVLKLSPTGQLLWVRKYGGVDNQVAYAIDVGTDGSVVTTGYLRGTADFDPGPGTAELTSAGERDIFVAKLTADGDHAWAHAIGGPGDDSANSVAIGPMGDIHITGAFHGEVDFDPSENTLLHAAEGDGSNLFVAKFAANGGIQWAEGIGGLNDESGGAIDVNARGDIYAAGYFAGTVDFDPGPSDASVAALGDWDICVLKFGPGGDFRWAHTAGGNSFDQANALAVNDSGRVYAAGFFQNSANFDPGSGLTTSIFGSQGDHDIFILQLSGADDIETGILSADSDGDLVISLSELLRVVQFYNSGGIYCADQPGDSEDGFLPGVGEKRDCDPYDSDYAPQDWAISLSELLRIVQFYNSGGYFYCPLSESEDGFCPNSGG